MGRRLTSAEIGFFAREGYLSIEGVVPEEVLDALRAEYDARLDDVAGRLAARGLVQDPYPNLPFDARYTALVQENGRIFDFLDITLPLDNDMPADAELHAGPAVFNLLTCKALLDIAESILGPELTSNPVQHVRIKPPQRALSGTTAANSYIGRTTWHQDQGALLDEANDSHILTIWVAVTDAMEENGCLVVKPGSHRSTGGLSIHCPGKGIAAENYIPSSQLQAGGVVTLPVHRGGIVLLHQHTQHAALPNRSDQLRWSFDLRYHVTGQPSGRPAFPSFVARSVAEPETELRSPAVWRQMWADALDDILSGRYDGQIYNEDRWKKYSNHSVCA